MKRIRYVTQIIMMVVGLGLLTGGCQTGATHDRAEAIVPSSSSAKPAATASPPSDSWVSAPAPANPTTPTTSPSSAITPSSSAPAALTSTAVSSLVVSPQPQPAANITPEKPAMPPPPPTKTEPKTVATPPPPAVKPAPEIKPSPAPATPASPPPPAKEMAALSEPMKPEAAPPAAPKIEPPKPPPAAPATGSFSATVKITADGSEVSPEGVIVMLEPRNSAAIPPRDPRQHVIEMVGKKYTPRNTLMRVGDTVVFKNLDPFKHNVFSSSPGNKFDLGTYGRGAEPEHVFAEPGVVKVYCNIHPDMSAIVMVGKADWGGITGPEGIIDFTALPAGVYEVTAWSIRGEHQETIQIDPGEIATAKITIDASKYQPVQHLNKAGKKYSTKQSDEFY